MNAQQQRLAAHLLKESQDKAKAAHMAVSNDRHARDAVAKVLDAIAAAEFVVKSAVVIRGVSE